MKKFCSFICLLAGLTATPAAAQQQTVLIKMSAKQLREVGIAIKGQGVEALPHSCRSIGSANISISEERLGAFQRRGFSLESVCLGLVGSFAFDPESGQPVPIAVLPNGDQYKLNIPDCFKRAVPYLDCQYHYEHDGGSKLSPKERKDNRLLGEFFHRVAQSQGGSPGVAYPYDNHGKRGEPYGDRAIMLARVVYSAALPLRYGYAPQHPEGDDPEAETVDLETYRKRGDGFSLWGD